MGEYSSENVVVHISTQCFPLLVQMTNWFKGVSVVICLAVRQGLIAMLLFLYVVQMSIPVSLHLFVFHSFMMFLVSSPSFLISYTVSVLVIVPTGSIRLLTSLRCNFFPNQEDLASVSGKPKCLSHKQ